MDGIVPAMRGLLLFCFAVALGSSLACGSSSTSSSSSSSSSSGGSGNPTLPAADGGTGSSSGGPAQPGITCTTQPGGCQCGTTSEANATRCSDSAIANAICCADSNWPTGGSCACAPPCQGLSDGCGCSPGGSSVNQSASSATCEKSHSTDNCCVDPVAHSCACENFGGACPFGRTDTASCTGYVKQCRQGMTQVRSCSLSP
jgi:hypothetical protein